jgi:hypothetical protein
MLEFMRYWKPEIRVHGGDCFDFRFIRKKADEQERREETEEDFEAGLQFISDFAPTHFLRGNHDERLWDLLRSDHGLVREFAHHQVERILKTLGNARMYPYDKRKGVCEIGQMRFVHGYATGVSATKTMALAYGAVMHGHTHIVESVTIARIKREVSRACGCLAKLDMDYNRGQIQTLRQSHGWVYGVLLPNGLYHAYQAMPINGKWYLPTEMREF